MNALLTQLMIWARFWTKKQSADYCSRPFVVCPVFGNIKGVSVAPGGIVLGHIWWCDRKRIDDVGIDGRPKALTFPVAGYLDLHSA